MNIKLDENLGSIRVVTQLRLAGHDVATVKEQGLTSVPDEELIEICSNEGRALVTLDRGFGNRLRFNPSDYAGIVVIRLPPRPSFQDFREAIDTLILGLDRAEVVGKLWIIQRGSIQEYQPSNTEENEQ